MTIFEKMNEIKGSCATKEQIKKRAYMNRVTVDIVHCDDGFEVLEKSVLAFIESESYGINEFENWDKFLDSEFIS